MDWTWGLTAKKKNQGCPQVLGPEQLAGGMVVSFPRMETVGGGTFGVESPESILNSFV